jgi:hypothetical protein
VVGVIIAHFEVPPREASADNYAGAAIFRIGAPAKQNVRAFLRIAQEKYFELRWRVRSGKQQR